MNLRTSASIVATADAPTTLGLALVTASNVCFSLRGLLSKRLKKVYGTDPFSLFFSLCAIGSALQLSLVLATALGGGVPLPALPARAQMPLLLANGVSFFAYLQVWARAAATRPLRHHRFSRTACTPCLPQLSWVCLGRMSAVSHSLANAMRRPATIAAALVLEPVASLTSLNLAGIVIACAGAALFALS